MLLDNECGKERRIVEGYRVVWTFSWNVWVREGMRQRECSRSSRHGQMDGSQSRSCCAVISTLTHTHTAVGTNEACLGACGIRLQEYRLKADWFIPRRDESEARRRGNTSLCFHPAGRTSACFSRSNSDVPSPVRTTVDPLERLHRSLWWTKTCRFSFE